MRARHRLHVVLRVPVRVHDDARVRRGLIRVRARLRLRLRLRLGLRLRVGVRVPPHARLVLVLDEMDRAPAARVVGQQHLARVRVRGRGRVRVRLRLGLRLRLRVRVRVGVGGPAARRSGA